jgi:hypothetical protein
MLGPMTRAVAGTSRNHQKAADRAPAAWLGVAFLVVVGSAWHFAVVASGESAVVGLLAPVNESVWEHTKLIAVPMLAWAALVGWRSRRMAPAVVAGVVGGVAGMVVMVVGYYAYVAVLGRGWFPMDIALFCVCAVVAMVVFERVRAVRATAATATLLVAAELAAFAALTVAPPDWPLFVPTPR